MSKIKNAIENDNIPYVIAETAYNHGGDFEYVNKLIDEILESSSSDAIKFHILLDVDTYMAPSHASYSTLNNFLFSESQWVELLTKVKSKNQEVIILVDDLKSIDFVKKNLHLIDSIELHAIALNNIEMLKKVKNIDLPLILGVGGSEQSDIEFALNFLNKKDVLLMHGFQNYPTQIEYINFNRMNKLKQKFNLNVGYADHTYWSDKNNSLLTLAGFMMGANIIEKHVTLNKGDKRMDFESAISIEDLKEIKNKLSILNKAKGDGSFEISEYENIYAKKGPMKFTIVASESLNEGDVITEENITFLRTGEENTIEQKEYLDLLGKKTSKKISKFGLINWGNVKK